MPPEAATERARPPALLSRWEIAPGATRIVLLYGVLITAAESIASYLPGPDGRYPSADGVLLGMVLHALTVFALLGHAALLSTRGARSLSHFTAALVAVPLIRIFSLSLPFFRFTLIEWLLIISAPLLIVSLSLMRILGLSPRAVGLGRPTPGALPGMALVALAGAPLGLIEYFILRPAQAWIPALGVVPLLGGALALVLSSGLAEELIFRGILLRKSLEVASPRVAVLLVTALFAVMHLGFLSPLDVVYVFAVGLFFAAVVVRSGSLYGVVASHSLANVVLYLLAPFLLPL